MFSSPKPYSAVTVHVDRLTSEQYEEDDVGAIPDLIEVIRIQASGPTEAARALRKKLKYGNTHRQLRALTILDSLVQNGDKRFQNLFTDEPLLERLRVMARDDMVDHDVKQKCATLFRQWAVYRKTPGLAGIAGLSNQLPKTKRPQPSQSKVIRETEREAQHDEPVTSPVTASHKRSASSKDFNAASSSSSRPNNVPLSAAPQPSSSIFKKDKKSKHKAFNLEKEKPQLMETVASASIASNNLLNGLQLINREQQRVSQDKEAVKRFETCKLLRRQILRYIQLVEVEPLIGALLNANDELVKALMAFEIMDKSIDDDSDSETEAAIAASVASSPVRPPHEAMGSLNIGQGEVAPVKPPRPQSIPMPPPAFSKQNRVEDSEPEDEDDDNPFADSNAVKTPHIEQGSWRDV